MEDTDPWKRIGMLFIMHPETHYGILLELKEFIEKNANGYQPLNSLRRSFNELKDEKFQGVKIHLVEWMPIGFIDYSGNIVKTKDKCQRITL